MKKIYRKFPLRTKIFLVSIISSLVGETCAFYEQNSVNDIFPRCQENSSCSGNISSTFSKYRNCQCDAQCSNYGDCCHDSPHFKPSNLSVCVRVGNWNTAGNYVDNYYMVKSCPASWIEEVTRTRCENYTDTIIREPTLGHPITSNATNITYVNYHCARCNNDLHINTMVRWKLAVTCDANMTFPTPDIDTVLKEATYVEMGHWFKPKFANASYHSCKLYVWRPLELLRRCHERIVKTCPSSWKNDTVRSQCESYTSLVFKRGSKPFRNSHCALCNNKAISQMWCTKEELEIEYTFPILFDYSDSSGDEVGRTRLCQNNNEAYDRGSKKCRNIIWSIAGQEGNYELDSCSGNVSECYITNCSKFVVNRDDFVLDNDFTARDLSSNKTYKKDEFVIMHDGSMQICANYQVSEEKFSDAMSYVTFLGLGISMVFLVLHMVAFIINPSLRNLSGKNLASLCLTLFFAYGAFIAGQLLQVGAVGCKVIAVMTYYCFLSSFSWLLLMAFDVWRTLRLSTVHLRVVSKESRRYAFAMYSVLGYIIFPGILVSTALVMENVEDETTFRPRFGTHNCWFGNRKALLFLFALPIALIMTLNVLFFVWSAHMICSSSMSSSKKSSSTRRDYKLFARLALLMGLTWTTGFLADYLNVTPVWYIFVALNAFQGLFIFLAFTLTQKVRNGIRSQVSGDSKTNSMENETSCWSWSNKSFQTENTAQTRT